MLKDQHAVLHGLAIKKYADAKAVAGVCSIPVSTVIETIGALKVQELVFESDGQYSLTPIGGIVLENDYFKFFGDLRRNKSLLMAYESFEVVNLDLKALITDWQVVERGGISTPNDHSDSEYDNRIIDRLGAIHERIEVILGQMATHETRLSGYLRKLQTALEHAEDGEIEWVSEVRIESYHTVWFELHEDLLRMLGKEREE